MLDIFFHVESWWKLALKDLPRRPCGFLEILSSLSDLASPWACVGGCDSCLIVPNGKFHKPNLCQLSLWNAMRQCKFPPTWEEQKKNEDKKETSLISLWGPYWLLGGVILSHVWIHFSILHSSEHANILTCVVEYYFKVWHVLMLWNICSTMERCVAFVYAASV